ncbi:ankyrin-3-like [Cloeon dipterum]|uniref:ankyrin-3-like n=1 Tax=Cloeon dipterum TaxID=197152 RepID=UPI0032200F49
MPNNITSIFDLLDKRNKNGSLPMLHRVATWGAIPDVRSLIGKTHGINARGGVDNATALHHAAKNRKCDKEMIELFLAHGATVEEKDSEGMEPVDYAVQGKNFETAEELLKHRTDGFDCSLLHYYIKKNDLESASAVYENDKTSANVVGKCGRTALQVAAQYGSLEMCFWIHNCSDVTQSASTILHYAVLNEINPSKVVKFFYSLYPDIDVRNPSNETPLHSALRAENLVAVEELLKRGASLKDGWNAFLFCVKENKLKSAKFVHEKDPSLINQPDYDGKKALQLAALHADLEMCRWLVSLKVVVDATDGDERTVLHLVALRKSPDVELVRYFAPLVANIDQADASDFSPLHCAIQNGSYATAKELIDQGANLRAKLLLRIPLHYFISQKMHDAAKFVYENDHQQLDMTDGPISMTSLHYAAKMADVRMCKWLVELGCDVDFRTPNKVTVLHCATFNKNHGKEIIEYFLQSSDLNVDVPAHNNQTPLHFALRNEHLEVAELLLSHGANIKVTIGKQNLLHYCVMHDKLNSAKFVHKKDRELIRALESDDKTALHLAAQYAGVDVCKWLVDEGVKVSEVDAHYNRTALHFVSQREKECKDIIKFFGTTGMDFAAKDTRGYSALALALSSGKFDMVEELLSLDVNLRSKVDEYDNVLQFCVAIKNMAAVKLLYNKDEKLINESGANRRTPLHIAAWNADVSMCRWLVNHGADVHALDRMHNNVFHYFAQDQENSIADHQRRDLVTFFKSKHVNVDQFNHEGNTPLHVALQLKNTSVAKYLIESGASLLLKREGKNYLLYCVQMEYLESSKLLHQMAPDLIKGCNEKGQNALHIAAQGGSLEMVTWLVGEGMKVDQVNEVDHYNVLHYATLNKKEAERLVRYFVAQRGPLNGKTNLEETPLHLALRSKNYAIAQMMVDLGADVDAIIGTEQTNMIHICVMENDLEGAKIVHRANPQLINQLATGKRNALHLAAFYGSLEMCHWLYEMGVDPHAKASENRSIFYFCGDQIEKKKFFLSVGLKKEKSLASFLRKSFRIKKKK